MNAGLGWLGLWLWQDLRSSRNALHIAAAADSSPELLEATGKSRMLLWRCDSGNDRLSRVLSDARCC